MEKSVPAAMLCVCLALPATAFAEDQCVTLPTQEAPPTARPSQAAINPPSPREPASAAALAAPQTDRRAGPPVSASDQIAAAGVPEATPEQIAANPGLAPIIAAGATIFVIGHGAGVPNFMAVNRDHFQMFIPMGDPHYLCRGMIQDDNGVSVTLEEASKIPGLVAPAGRDEIRPTTSAADALEEMPKTGFGTVGPAAAPTVWAIVDPLCAHSQQAIRALLPYAQSGKIQLKIVPVSVISPQSAAAARVLLSAPPDQMIKRWFEPGILQASYDLQSEGKLNQNNRLFAGLALGMHVSGVPELLWTAAGVAQSKAGLDTGEVASFIASVRG